MPLWDFFDEMERRRRRHYKLFKDFGVRPLMMEGFREPLTDVRETSNSIIVDMELPGVTKNDVEINVMEDELEVKSVSKTAEEVKKKEYYRKERSYHGFYRRFKLPAKVVPNKSKAKFMDGVLHIKMPKAAVQAKEKKKVKVEVK